ncbi:MAG: hypothetical protein GXY83_18840 [Rhodopirellula sp.]|nr:hypothetical protein [Rhodopirellula sp.]
MTTADFVEQLARQDIRLKVDGGNLRISAPQGAITPGLVNQITLRKPEIVQLLTDVAQQSSSDDPKTPIYIDLETRSACNLKRFGGRRYAQDPTTEILSVVAMLNDRVMVWMPLLSTPLPANEVWPQGFRLPRQVLSFAGPEIPAPLLACIAAGHPLCAHNALDFDALVWRAKGLPEPSAWIDTLPMAHAAGFPGKLDELGKRILGRGKDKEGSALIKKLSRANRDGVFRPLTRETAAALARYNVVDVLLLPQVLAAVDGCLEPDVFQLDQAVNQRGVVFDVDLARALFQVGAQDISEASLRVEQLSDGKITRHDLRRNRLFQQWLRSKGISLPNMKRSTIHELLQQSDLDDKVRQALESREIANRITTSKLDSAVISSDSDGRLRHLFVYHKAVTGRWAGRNVQPQNLPKPHKDLGDVSQLIDAVTDVARFRQLVPAGVKISDAISALIRPCFRAATGHMLCSADFAGIEARGVAWCADEHRQLTLFAEGGDNYCDLAQRIFGYPVTKANKRERNIGKVAVLGCGYGMGARKFAAKCVSDGVDLAAANTSAEAVVDHYRDTYQAVAGVKVHRNGRTWREGGLWKALEAAAKEATTCGSTTYAGKCTFFRDRDALVIELPSGRRQRYRNARVQDAVPGYCRDIGLPAKPKPTLFYDGPKSTDIQLYGGKLAENIVSGICRDLLVAAMLECEQVGLPVVLHVHDEIVIEVSVERSDEALRQLLCIMSTPPAWAPGFPIEVEGFSSARYFKTPPAGAAFLSARNGRILPVH